jgi:beta-fructofuranosidase
MSGWLADDELSKEARASQGWTGAMAMPHELFVQETTNVVSAFMTPLDKLPSFQTQAAADGTYTVWTLGQQPLAEVQGARGQSVAFENMKRSLVWELDLVANVEKAQKVTLTLSFAQGESITSTLTEGHATIEYTPSEELLLIRRHESTNDQTINTLTDHGKHTLFRKKTGLEALHLRVFYDTSILKVFANDRCVITSRLYAGACSAALDVQGEVQDYNVSVWAK